MVHTFLLAFSLSTTPCDNPFTRGDTLFPQDASASAVLAALPRDDSTAGAVGILFTTQVFAHASREPRDDADSALLYLARAQALCPASPIFRTYWCVARMLRVQYRKQYETQFIFDTIRLVFTRADSLVQANPENRTVQFLIGCLFQNAHWMMSDAVYYWERAKTILTKLDAEGAQPTALRSFFTAEIRANIRLNLAHLCVKDGSAEGKIAREQILRTILTDFPNTLAAERARTFLPN